MPRPRTRQINDCQGSTVKVFLKNGDVLTGELTFFNYEEQVIQLRDYELYREERLVEKGDFWVVNGRSWHNLSVEKVKQQ